MMNSAELFANLQGGKAGCSIAIASDVNAADDRIGSVRCPNVPSGQYTGAKGAYITREFMQGYTGTRWFVLQTQAIYFFVVSFQVRKIKAPQRGSVFPLQKNLQKIRSHTFRERKRNVLKTARIMKHSVSVSDKMAQEKIREERWRNDKNSKRGTRPMLNQITNMDPVVRAISCIERHVAQPVDLETVANAAGYSKYHLHRIFTRAVGMTVHQYIRRRKLTEAARLLTFSNKPIMDIAITCGYESRQAFTTVFKEMYKKTPGQYRKEGLFYPLQLEYKLKAAPAEAVLPWEAVQAEGRKPLQCSESASSAQGAARGSQLPTIRPASDKDIPTWMELVRLVIDGYPCLEEESYKKNLNHCIRRGRAMILEAGSEAVGIMAFDESCGSIDFMGIHPQYRRAGLENAFLEQAFGKSGGRTFLTMTTFRQGDKADTGYRGLLKSLGFREEQLLVEFGYPTQRMILTKKDFQQADLQRKRTKNKGASCGTQGDMR